MGEFSEISWTTHTFNPWWGCTKVSEGCRNCYAATFAKRVGQDVWGAHAARRTFGAKHWLEPVKWNAAAKRAKNRPRVFCASMADVFEDRRDLDDHRERLWALIEETPRLDWLLLTKRPDVMARLWPWPGGAPANVWAGTTVEDQRAADERIDILRTVPASVRFLSMEPLVGPVTVRDWTRIDWAILGGESGPGCRPCAVEWIDAIVADAVAHGVSVWVKQVGAKPTVGGDRVVVSDPKGGALRDIPRHLRIRRAPLSIVA